MMAELALTARPSWTFRFTVMLTLAVVVAVMGLLADSAAVVIGAMLLAPLMVPVLGLAAALAMGLPNKIAAQGSRVAVSTVWCVGVAYAMSALIPANGPVTSEVLSRTSPDIKDLIVALAAGLAGAYATVRADTSAALPGVAVAVALVPPLGTVGISLEAGRVEQAQGAFLLYVTNLVGIVLIGLAVFVVTGFVPPRRLAKTSKRLAFSVFISAVAFAGIATVLLAATRSATEQAQENQRVNEAIRIWLSQSPELRITGFDRSENRLSLEVSGPLQPPDKEELRPLIDSILGEVLLSVQWVKTEEATTTTTTPATTLAATEEELLLGRIEPLVEEWLVLEDNGNGYEVQGVFLSGRALRVDVVGSGDPPSVNDLADILAERLPESELELDVTWIRREVAQPGTTVPNPIEIQRDLMLAAASTFATTNEVTLQRFEFDGGRVLVELVGATPPDATPLIRSLLDISGSPDPDTVDVFFSERIRLAVVEPTTTTEP